MRLGIDTGGTYTDAVLFNGKKGVVHTAKSLTTHHDLSIGIREVIQRIDNCSKRPLSDIVELTSISTTLATNAIVEGHGGTICLLLIGHSHDALKRAQLNHAIRNDPVEMIRGGHTALGDEIEPLDLDAARQAIERHRDSITAFAVAGIFSVRNTEHEIAVRDLILEMTDTPVTCSFELSSKLNGPRRAMTTALNARLIAPISELIRTVRDELKHRGIDSPFMVVKGDGSMIGAEMAASRPVETILSGPAASVVGACRLSKADVRLVSDIGGTTTDVAMLENGTPRVAREGATVGGFRTFVEAVDIYTVGLGGDSQVGFGEPIEIGPERALPLCVLAQRNPAIIETLRSQVARRPQEYQGCFAVLRKDMANTAALAKSERVMLEQIRTGPVSCEKLYRDLRMFRAFLRLRAMDIAILAAFTPTDSLHVLDKMDRWSKPAAELGAQLWARGFRRDAKPVRSNAEKFSQAVIDQVIERSCEVLVSAAIASEFDMHKTNSIDSILLRKGISPTNANDTLKVDFSFGGTVVAVGAPAAPLYPEICRRLNTPLDIPEHAAVGNAVGAVAGGISQRMSGLVTAPAEGVYRAHTPLGMKDFGNLEDAANFAQSELESMVEKSALESNARNPVISSKRKDIIVGTLGIDGIFIESQIYSYAYSDSYKTKT